VSVSEAHLDRYPDWRFLADASCLDEVVPGEAGAVVLGSRALAIFRESGCRDDEGHTMINLGDAHAAHGEHALAADFHHHGLALFRATGDRSGEACAHNGLGEAAYGSGRPDMALDAHRNALAIAAQTGGAHTPGIVTSVHRRPAPSRNT
jgi:hypothetical protein